MTIQLQQPSLKIGKYSIFVFVLFLLFIFVWQFPMHWLSPSVEKVTGCKVGLFQVEGTFWRGSASISFSVQNDNKTCKAPTAVSERFYWHSSCSLFSGQCQTDIFIRSALKPVRIITRLSGIEIQNNQIQLPAEILVGLGSPWNSLQPKGTIDIHWNNLFLTENMTGNLNVKINNLSSAISKIRPLGSYELKIQLDPPITANLITLNGPLILNGQGKFMNQSLQFEGSASSTPEAKNSLAGLLSVIGIKNGDNYQLKF
jgi:general secretion pathway protein N